MLRIINLLLLALILLSGEFYAYAGGNTENNDVMQSALYQSGNIYQKDYLLFVNIMESVHPAFADSMSVEADSLLAVYSKLSECSSRADFEKLLQSELRRLNDNHTFVSLSFNQNFLFPIQLLSSGDKMFINGISSEYKEMIGSEIKMLNGKNVDDIVVEASAMFSSGTRQELYSYVSNYASICSFWKEMGYEADSLVLVTVDGNGCTLHRTSKNVVFNNMTWYTKRPSLSVRERSKQPFLYKMLNGGHICYLQINSMQDRSTVDMAYRGKVADEKLAAILARLQRFDAFVDSMFLDIKVNNSNTLVVDLRDNGGGNSALADVLLSYLMPDNKIRKFQSFIRISSLWEQQYPSMVGVVKNAMSKIGMDYHYGSLFCQNVIGYESDTLLFKHNKGDVFDGKVYFIINERTMSSAGMLVTLAHDNNIGVIIGSESSFTASHYGDMLVWSLPNTGVKGFVSHKRFVRPDADVQQNIIVPDVLIYDIPYDGIDNCWSYIVSNEINVTN